MIGDRSLVCFAIKHILEGIQNPMKAKHVSMLFLALYNDFVTRSTGFWRSDVNTIVPNSFPICSKR